MTPLNTEPQEQRSAGGTELKPCPFCGGKADFERTIVHATIRCHECGCSIMKSLPPGLYADYRRQEQQENELASIAWNRRAHGWLPIESAPKDRLIDVWTVGYGAEPLRMSDCYYDRICDEWRTSRPSGRLMCIKAKYVTHWMPIPSPPINPPVPEGEK